MKKEYIAPTMLRYATQPLMISVSKGTTPVDDPTLVESRKFWGTSLFEEDTEEEDDDLI